MEIKVNINKIIKFSNVDGPGNRMAIFFQGCNYNCLYCHNPETINHCDSCGRCVKNCPSSALEIVEGKVSWKERKCIECDLCIKSCLNESSPKTINYRVNELIEEVKKVKLFIQGVTVSGGEATLNYKFIALFFKKVKEMGLTTFIDTNGSLELWKKEYSELIKETDKFMIDMKCWDEEKHIELTGVSNRNVIENIKYLGQLKKIYEVRSVVVPKNLNNEETIIETAKLIKLINEENQENIRYKLIKYREIGVRESILNKKLKAIPTPSSEEMEKYRDKVREIGIKSVVII